MYDTWFGQTELSSLGHFLHLFWDIWHLHLLSVVLLGMWWTVLCLSLCNNMQFNFLLLLFKSHLKIWALLCNKIRNYGHLPKDKYLFHWHKIYLPTPFPYLSIYTMIFFVLMSNQYNLLKMPIKMPIKFNANYQQSSVKGTVIAVWTAMTKFVDMQSCHDSTFI